MTTSDSCRDVLSVAKKLTKEREEMCRELGRIYDSMLELHDAMTMEIQVSKPFETQQKLYTNNKNL